MICIPTTLATAASLILPTVVTGGTRDVRIPSVHHAPGVRLTISAQIANNLGLVSTIKSSVQRFFPIYQLIQLLKHLPHSIHLAIAQLIPVFYTNYIY